jgi:5'-3' exonuclease
MTLVDRAKKVVVLDYGYFVHTAGHANKNSPDFTGFTAMSMIIANLREIKISKEDLIIIACDKGHSWRKELEKQYKANRKEIRAASGIDWKTIYHKADELLDRIERNLNWYIVEIETLEADDIMAVASRFYSDKEVVLVTRDSDLEQMWIYKNVKIFNPYNKEYKIPPEKFNVYKFLEGKIKKESTDNLKVDVTNQEEYTKRRTCVCLTELPEWVEESVVKKLNKIEPSTIDLDNMRLGKFNDRIKALYESN